VGDAGKIANVYENNEGSDIIVKWILNGKSISDLYTKNLSGPTFEKHASVYVGKDEYMIKGAMANKHV
jgi:hypothetical protein